MFKRLKRWLSRNRSDALSAEVAALKALLDAQNHSIEALESRLKSQLDDQSKLLDALAHELSMIPDFKLVVQERELPAELAQRIERFIP